MVYYPLDTIAQLSTHIYNDLWKLKIHTIHNGLSKLKKKTHFFPFPSPIVLFYCLKIQ